MKRILLVGLCIGVAYFLVLALVLTIAIPPGTDDFGSLDPESFRFQLGVWVGSDVLPPMFAIMTPVAWLLHSIDGDDFWSFWLAAIPYVLLLGIIISLVCHGVGALVRARQT